MTRVAKAELLHVLRLERDGVLLEVSGLREPMKRRFRKRPMDPLAAKCLANERARRSEQASASARKQRRKR